MNKLLTHTLILILTACTLLMAQSKGRISGLVVDKETNEALAGVNITVKGTYLGASTDLDGFFLIPEVSPGQYEVEVTYIGYKIIRQTGVTVTAGQSTNLKFELESSVLALGQDIEVIGEKPLMDIEQTSTVRSVSKDDIENRIVNNTLDVISQQVGVVAQDDGLHIRGGRAYESQYMLDGISVQDPLSGTGYGLNLSANSLEEVEVITGGYKAEYGQATSGVINVRTKSGGDQYEGFLQYKSDNYGVFQDRPWSFNTDNLEFNVGGPDPITGSVLPAIGLNLPGNFYFFLSFYTMISDDYTRSTADQLYSSIAPTFNGWLSPTSLAPRQDNNWSGVFKFKWKIDPTHQLIFAYNRSIAINQNSRSLQTNLEYVEPTPGFPYNFSKNLDDYNTYTHDNEQISLTWNQTLDPKTFYEIRLSRYYAHLRSDWEGNIWNDYNMAVDVARLPVEYFTPASDSTKIRVIPGDGFYDYGNYNVWHDHFVKWYTFKGDLTRRQGDIHTLKGGFELSFKDMQLVDILDPWVGDYGATQDVYRVQPADGAIYLQDDLRFEGFILNAGLRLDYWFPGKYADDAVKDTNTVLSEGVRKKYMDETSSLFGLRYKMRLMPRIGVSHPISNNLMLYFNYGHFSKLPKPQFVYAKLGPTSSQSAYQKYGNPALDPETSVKYELGIRYKITEDDVINITTYYKDIFDYVQTVTFTSDRRGFSGITYTNLDYARSRGVEAEFKTRIGRYFFGDVTGSYSITTTKASSADVGYLIAQQQLDEPPVKETYAAWDRPWQIGINAAIRVPAGEHPDLFGLSLFDNWDLSLRFFAEAGRRYTPTELSYIRQSDGRPMYDYVTDQTRVYEKIGPPWSWVDLRFVKNFNVWGMVYSINLEIRNLFNQKNTEISNPVNGGKAYEYGDPVLSSWNDPRYPDRYYPVSSPYPFNPARYRAPRQIILGFSTQF